MIPENEFKLYVDWRGELPDTGPLTRLIEANHPDWDFFEVCDYARRLYRTSAMQIEARTAAIRAHTREIEAKTADLQARRRRASDPPPAPKPRHLYEAAARRLGFTSEWRWGNGKEVDAWILNDKDLRYKRLQQVYRIRKRFDNHVKMNGFPCRVCGEVFKSRQPKQRRCSECIAARKRKGGAR